MSSPNALPVGILIAGDSTVDWAVAEPADSPNEQVDIRFAWTMFEGPGISSMPGGAALDTRLLEALSRHKQPDMPIAGPIIPEETLGDPFSLSITRTFAHWTLLPKTTRDRERVWRITRSLGLHPAREFRGELPRSHSIENPACVLLEDGNLFFRDRPDVWPPELFLPETQIVIRQTGGLGTGLLWDRLMTDCADRTTLFCMIGDLRANGATIGQPMSWERTAQEIARAARANTALTKAARIVVGLGASGAVIVERDGADLLIYDPRMQEGDWERQRPGQQFGTGTMDVVALAWAFARKREAVSPGRASMNGIEAARVLHGDGFQTETGETGLRIDFPYDRLVDALNGDADRGEIACVEISHEASWRIFDAAGDFRDAAERIARFGVDRAGSDVPLETMGHWSSIDRTEIESMRSVRNIIAEYLASRGRSRPLSLAVFGPPGSGKSFAIKQMASVIGVGPVPLQTLEFNLSQFHGIDELPGAFQQIRDLRLRESLPLVFWDEFDSMLAGHELGWLVNFLAPMQDGVFTEDGIARPIGPAIFIFAGGTHATMDSFKNRALERPEAKATDFLSRLRGYVDVLGPNPETTTDRTYHLRRAMLLRSILLRTAPQIFDGSELRIDRVLLDAFLDVPRYLHGSRSMEAIVEMSAISRKLTYDRSILPAAHQLELHVDASAFMQIAQESTTAGRNE